MVTPVPDEWLSTTEPGLSAGSTRYPKARICGFLGIWWSDNEQDGPSMGHFHVAAQTRGFASFLHSLSLVLARPCAKDVTNEKDEPSLVHFHVAAQTRGFASLLHSLSLVLARPCAKSLMSKMGLPVHYCPILSGGGAGPRAHSWDTRKPIPGGSDNFIPEIYSPASEHPLQLYSR